MFKKPSKTKIIIRFIALAILCIMVAFTVWQLFKKVPTSGDWQQQLAILSIAQFDGDRVMIKNVRNFRYSPTEKDMRPAYYDKTYDITKIKRAWYVTEPFNQNESAAHTFVSFEFQNGDFLAISIEGRKTKDQDFSLLKGMFRTYPLVYIAADERDVVLLRANVRKDRVYAYPVKLTRPENARALLTDMLTTMNELATTKPAWYHTLFANCTSSIVRHVNKITPGRISPLSWQLWLTASADELALKHGLLDTDLPIEKAREKYLVSERSLRVGDVKNYSHEIRKFED